MPIATDGLPLGVLVIHCQPQATQQKWRSAELIVDNDGMGHDNDDDTPACIISKHDIYSSFSHGLKCARALLSFYSIS